VKVVVEVDSQEEFDEKRPFLIKALAGTKMDLSFKSKALAPKTPTGKFQAEVFEYWNKKFDGMLKELKEDINAILGE
jgi:hypothetical protein